MGTKKLLIAALLLAALSGVLWWSNKNPDWGKEKKAEAETPVLVNVPDASLDGVDIQKKDGTKVSLEHKNGKWSITEPATYPADQDAVSSIATAIAPANADSVVDEKPADVGKYGLTNPALTVTIHEKGKSDQILFGDDIPAGSMVYVRVAGNPRVYAAATSLKTSFDKSVDDLRDKRLLTFDQKELTRITLAADKSNIEFGKNAQNEWTIVQPQPYRADNFQVEELVRKLGEAKMDLKISPGDAQKAQRAYNAATPVATVKLTDASGTQTFEVHESGEDYYGRSSVVGDAYKLTAELGKVLEKPLDEFRNKKLFDFGFTDPTKLEIQGKTYTKTGNDWKVDGKVLDSASVQALIDKLRDLSATKFTATGVTTAVASISVVSNDGKRTEKVDFSKAVDGYVATRGAEPGLYLLDAKSVDDILEASTKVKPAAAKK